MGVLGSSIHSHKPLVEPGLEVMSISYESLLPGFQDRAPVGLYRSYMGVSLN